MDGRPCQARPPGCSSRPCLQHPESEEQQRLIEFSEAPKRPLDLETAGSVQVQGHKADEVEVKGKTTYTSGLNFLIPPRAGWRPDSWCFLRAPLRMAGSSERVLLTAVSNTASALDC